MRSKFLTCIPFHQQGFHLCDSSLLPFEYNQVSILHIDQHCHKSYIQGLCSCKQHTKSCSLNHKRKICRKCRSNQQCNWDYRYKTNTFYRSIGRYNLELHSDSLSIHLGHSWQELKWPIVSKQLSWNNLIYLFNCKWSTNKSYFTIRTSNTKMISVEN